MTLDLRAALVCGPTKRVSRSLEGMDTNLLGPTDPDPRLFELGTGVRLDVGKALFDLGYRRMMLAQDGAHALGRQHFVLGTHRKS